LNASVQKRSLQADTPVGFLLFVLRLVAAVNQHEPVIGISWLSYCSAIAANAGIFFRKSSLDRHLTDVHLECDRDSYLLAAFKYGHITSIKCWSILRVGSFTCLPSSELLCRDTNVVHIWLLFFHIGNSSSSIVYNWKVPTTLLWRFTTMNSTREMAVQSRRRQKKAQLEILCSARMWTNRWRSELWFALIRHSVCWYIVPSSSLSEYAFQNRTCILQQDCGRRKILLGMFRASLSLKWKDAKEHVFTVGNCYYTAHTRAQRGGNK